MSTEAKEPGQRAYEAWLGPRHGSAWLELDEGGKITWAAVEQACAVPAPAVEAWVPCEERMPEHGVPVLVAGGAAYFDGKHWQSMMCEVRPIQWEVTHWQPMPLPPPPKEGR